MITMKRMNQVNGHYYRVVIAESVVGLVSLMIAQEMKAFLMEMVLRMIKMTMMIMMKMMIMMETKVIITGL